ncbi:MAG: 3D domain-containing protein [Planctomycetes bacterium]|nr:3D domain-containing protein [Planctomycetota bacterium]
MLLTAVTDYGSGRVGKPPMMSAALDSTVGLASAILPVEQPPPQARLVEAVLPIPAPPQLFRPSDSDPLLERREAEQNAHLNRGKVASQKLLKWDEDGWYREEVALVTAYCPCPKCCGTQSPGITSIGKNAWTPGLAADPLYLGYGTRVNVPGYGLSVVDDTGGAMRRHWRKNGFLHIDVRMTYHWEARRWGKQYIRVKIYVDN